MSYDPNRPYGGPSDPYGQQPPPDPYGQQPPADPYGQQPPPADPYGQPAPPYGSPQSGVPYGSPQSGVPYNQPQSGSPYNQPQPGSPYGQPQYDQPITGQPYGQTAPLPSGDPYANPAGPYANPGGPYANPSAPFNADPYAAPAGPYGYPGGQPGYPAPPPPKKSKTGWIVGTIVAVVVIIIVFCSVGGVLISHSSNSDNTSSGSTATTGPTDLASESASTAPSPADSRKLIQPAGAPFSYRLPTGFQSVSTPSSQTTGSSAKFSAAAATTQTEVDDFLIVDAYALSYDANAVSRTELGTQFDSLVKQIGQDPTSRQNVTYNGNFGFWYQFDFTSSKAYSYFLFNGTNEIQVRCQWADQETTIKRGCEDVLKSLTITE